MGVEGEKKSFFYVDISLNFVFLLRMLDSLPPLAFNKYLNETIGEFLTGDKQKSWESQLSVMDFNSQWW